MSLDGDKLKIKAPPGALTDAMKEQLKQHKAELIEFLQDTGKQVVTDIEVRADRSKPLPLSFGRVVALASRMRASSGAA